MNKHLIFYLYLFIISYVLMFVIITIHNYVQNIEWMDKVKIRSKFLWKFLLIYKRKYTLYLINNNSCNKKSLSPTICHINRKRKLFKVSTKLVGKSVYFIFNKYKIYPLLKPNSTVSGRSLRRQ